MPVLGPATVAIRSCPLFLSLGAVAAAARTRRAAVSPAADQSAPPCASITRRPTGSARPRPPRHSSNGGGVVARGCGQRRQRRPRRRSSRSPTSDSVSDSVEHSTTMTPGSPRSRSAACISALIAAASRVAIAGHHDRSRHARLEADPAVFALMHTARQLHDESAPDRRLTRGTAISPASSLPSSLISATSAPMRAHDLSASSQHLPLFLGERSRLFAQQHPQVAGRDGDGCSQFMHGERQRSRKKIALRGHHR